MQEILIHDPRLAREVHGAMTRTWGGRTRNYKKWLRLVKELAEGLGIVLIDPYAKRKLEAISVRIPEDMVREIDRIARDLDTSRSTIVRIALELFVRTWGVEDERGQDRV